MCVVSNLVFMKNQMIVVAATYKVRIKEKKKKFDMNTQMGSALLTEKLDRTNFVSWEYKMHQYLVSQGYWSYVEGANKNQPNPTHADHPSWEQPVSQVLYCLASCIHDHMLGYIREAKTPKEAWGNLKKIFAARTTTRKLHHGGTTSNRGICQSATTPWRSRSYVTPLGRSMSILTTKKWCRYASEPSTTIRRNKVGCPREGESSLVLQSPVDVTSQRKLRPNKRQRIWWTNALDTQIQTNEEDKAMEQGANQANQT